MVMITRAPSCSSGRGVLSFPPVFEPRELLLEVLGRSCARFPCGTGLPGDGGATIMMMMMMMVMMMMDLRSWVRENVVILKLNLRLEFIQERLRS